MTWDFWSFIFGVLAIPVSAAVLFGLYLPFSPSVVTYGVCDMCTAAGFHFRDGNKPRFRFQSWLTIGAHRLVARFSRKHRIAWQMYVDGLIPGGSLQAHMKRYERKYGWVL